MSKYLYFAVIVMLFPQRDHPLAGRPDRTPLYYPILPALSLPTQRVQGLISLPEVPGGSVLLLSKEAFFSSASCPALHLRRLL